MIKNVIKEANEKKKEQKLKEGQQLIYGAFHLLIDQKQDYYCQYITLPRGDLFPSIKVDKRGWYSIILSIKDIENIPFPQQNLIWAVGIKIRVRKKERLFNVWN